MDLETRNSKPWPERSRRLETRNSEEWDRLAEALNRYGIRHVAPGGPPRGRIPSDPAELFSELDRASSVRLQEAVIFLLLTYPELAPAAQAAIEGLDGVRRDKAMRKYVAACALQRMWRTRIALALGPRPLIPPAFLDEFSLPSLEEDYGRATLLALAADEEACYGYHAWAGYTSLMDLFLREIELRRWGQPTLGVGGWGLGPLRQSPIPNPRR